MIQSVWNQRNVSLFVFSLSNDGSNDLESFKNQERFQSAEIRLE